jgi:hypothetical protein
MTRIAEARTLIQTADLPSVETFAADAGLEEVAFDSAREQALVVGSDVVSFTTGVDAEFRQAIADSSLFAQLLAVRQVGENADPIAFFDAYFSTLLGLGWIVQSRDTAEIALDNAGLEVHEAVIGVITSFLGPAAGPVAVAAVIAVLKGLRQMDADKPFITLFNKRSRHGRVGRFQFTYVRKDPAQGLLAEIMAFALNADHVVTQVLFFRLHRGSTTLRRSLASLSVDTAALSALRPNLASRMRAFRTALIAEADLGPVPEGD